MERCPIDKALIQPSDEVIVCEACQTTHHKECWDRNGGCSIYACRAAPVLEKMPAPPIYHRGWGDEKECPQCYQQIAASLMVCRCGAKFPWADPMTAMEYHDWLQSQQSAAARRTQLIVLFVITLLGIPAPVTGVIAGVQAYRFHEEMAGEHGAFLALGYGAAVIGAVYSLILLLFAVGL